MKSGKFILKNQYQERLSDNDQTAHQKNLMNINYKSTVSLLNKKELETLEQQKKRNQYKANAAKFQQNEIEKQRSIENQSLVDRMLKVHNSPNKSMMSKDLSSSNIQMQRSLINISQKKEDQRVYEENIKLAKRMMNLPPVINTNKLINNYRKHESDLQNAKKYHKLTPLTAVPKPTNKYSVYVDVLNDLTNDKFESSKSHITFPNIESKINRNTLLCLLQLQNLYLLNNYDLKNPKVPPQFSWEIRFKNKKLSMTIPKPYPKVKEELVDFVFKQNAVDQIELILWKVKNYDEVYIGQIELDPDDFDQSEVVQEFSNKLIKEKLIEKKICKKVNDCVAELGSIQLKLIIFCATNIPQNKHSGIPGSPTDPDIRALHAKIDESKKPQNQWQWKTTQEDENLLFQMEESFKEGQMGEKPNQEEISGSVATIITIYNDKMEVLAQIELLPGAERNSARLKLTRKLKKKDMEAVQSLLQSLENNENLTEVHKKMRELGLRGRITRKHIDEGLKESGATMNQLLLEKKDEMGLCLFDSMFLEDDKSSCQYPLILEIFNKMDLVSENPQIMEEFAANFFKNIALHLRRNKNLKPTIEFVKALKEYPGMAIVVNTYAQQHGDGINNPFLSEFNLNNYEHLLLLGKVVKLVKNFVQPDDKFMLMMENSYQIEKKKVYFKVPVLPRKLNISQKKDMLSLPDVGTNIMHEIVRRKKWNLFNRGFQNGADMCFSKDATGQSAFMDFTERASFDVFMNICMNFGFADPQDPEKEVAIKEDYLYDSTKSGKNIIHCLIMNKDPSQVQLLNSLHQILAMTNDQDKKRDLLTQVWESRDVTPIALYLDKLFWRLRKSKKILKEIPTVLQITDILGSYCRPKEEFNLEDYLYQTRKMSEIFSTKFNIHTHSIDHKGMKLFFEEEEYKPILEHAKYYHSNIALLARLLASLDDQLVEEIEKVIDWIDWTGYSRNFPDEKFIRDDFLFLYLIKYGKLEKTMSVIDEYTKEIVLIN